MISNSLANWLLEGPPWIQYRTRIDLMEQSTDDREVIAARQAMLKHPSIKTIISELAEWPGPSLKRHNDAGHFLHKLVFISDLGIQAGDPGVEKIIKKIMERQSQVGAFQTMANVSPNYGGSGKDQLAWMLCDAPSILYSLAKIGIKEDAAVQSAARHLASLSTDIGFPCNVAPEFGKFRGPGRKSDPCPYATLIALKALAQFSEWHGGQACKEGTHALLQLWEQRKERRPYLFAMGTDFAKLKAPFVWYDILHVLEVLTQFPFLKTDQRLTEMANLIKAKAGDNGQFTAESVWKAWSKWEFGQKRMPSSLMTFNVYRILQRLAQV
jgi:hypothetical protein